MNQTIGASEPGFVLASNPVGRSTCKLSVSININVCVCVCICENWGKKMYVFFSLSSAAAFSLQVTGSNATDNVDFGSVCKMETIREMKSQGVIQHASLHRSIEAYGLLINDPHPRKMKDDKERAWADRLHMSLAFCEWFPYGPCVKKIHGLHWECRKV